MTVMSSVSASSSVFSSAPDWIGETMVAIRNQKNSGGLIGMLQNSGGNGSIKSFLKRSSGSANALATISQTGITNQSSLIAQIAAQNMQEAQGKLLEKVFKELNAARSMVQPKNVLDPTIFFADGSTLDTTTNIMTMVNGKKYDTTTGALYVDPASIIQMANGAYLNTSTNILTMADGTQIDTVTGLKVEVTA